jgi:FkbH-like protein
MIRVISDFNVDLLGTCLARHLQSPAVRTQSFVQVSQVLAAGEELDAATTAVVWTRPEGVIEGFRRALALERVDHDEVLEDVERYKRVLASVAARCRHVLVPEWILAPDRRLFGLLDLKHGTGVRTLLARMNLSLAALMDTASNLYVLPVAPWLHAAGPHAYSSKLDLIARTPFSRGVFDAAAREVANALRTIEGHSRKVVVVDLDDTLWGGIVGDDGWEQLRLGGHDHVGEAFVAFQRSLLALRNRGIQLAIASKNTEAVAIEAMVSHPEMVLRPSHFAGWRINWADKAQNLLELSEELHLGLQSFVFIDDNPAERARIKDALPDVLVPDLPIDPALRAAALERLDCFDLAQITDEDFARNNRPSVDRLRTETASANQTLGEWLETLETRVRVEPLSTTNLPRVTQLFNKTNQLNLQTRRLTSAEIRKWLEPANRRLWAIRVQDKFGDVGLTGVISVELSGETATVADLILSCRVLGRQVEHALFNVASAFALGQQARCLRVEYRQTPRNAPCLKMLEESRLTRVSDHVFEWREPYPYELPSTVSLA